MNRTVLEWVGAVGVLAFPLFYLIRLATDLPSRYDDLGLRLVATFLCLLVALRKWWPEKAERFYLAFSYLTICYSLSFLLTFTMLHNGGATNSVVNMVIGTALIILLADWRNALIMLASGYLLSFGIYLTTSPDPVIPMEILYWWMPLCALIVVVGALSKFGDKQAELERIHKLYAGLAGSIAHEMRNPIMHLAHTLEVVAASTPPIGGADSVSLTRRQVLAITGAISEGNSSIARGLQSILITLQQLKPDPFDEKSFRYLSAARCVEKAVNEYAYETKDARSRVHVKVTGDFMFRGDETILVMIIFNLLKNAIYYFPMRQDNSLTISIGGEHSGQIVVRDTGPGIKPELMEHLFGDFQTAGKSEGTGLGLAFCKRAMLAFGGDITCQSELEQFTAFTLTFPVVSQEVALAHQQAVITRARGLLADKQVLVVDDDPFMRHATSAKLALLGCAIDEADDGVMALEMLGHSHYDLVIMDINMPMIDGYETTLQIRQGAVPGRALVPVLGHSANPAAIAAIKARQVGMNGFLAKPCTAHEMAQAAADALESAKPKQGAGPPRVLNGKTVLLADDSSINRSIVKTYLGVLGMQVIEAAHGAEVLQAIKAGARPDIILMDMNMPGMGGLETTRALRKMPPPAGQIPVVALTGNASGEHKAAALAAGMNGFLSKPVDTAKLQAELAPLLGDHGAEQDHGLTEPPLLDRQRIANFEQMGGQDLLIECVAHLHIYAQRLDDCVAADDQEGAREALHGLVGLSGEAGAQALHECASRIYRDICDGDWPQQAGWMLPLKDLVERTEKAIADHCERPSQALTEILP